jgi:hypothetical protein
VGSNGYRIGLELSSKYKNQIEAFASFIGVPLKDIKNRIRLRLYKGDFRKYEMSYLKKGCKPLVEDLVDKGFLDLKNGNEGIPRFVKRLLFNAKKDHNWRNNKQAKIAFAWLLGFFDGDGTVTKPNKGRIYSNNSKLLQEIKLFFEIDYDVIINHDGQEIEFVTITSDSNFIISSPQFSLLLDEMTFNFMKNSYLKGLARKRKN